MKAVKFPQANIEIAKDQPEYNSLPAYYGQVGDDASTIGIITCFELDDADIEALVANRKLWYRCLTFGKPLQPFNIFARKDMFDFEREYKVADFPVVVEYDSLDLKLSFWQKVKLLFGFTAHLVLKVNVSGFAKSVKVEVQNQFLWTKKNS